MARRTVTTTGPARRVTGYDVARELGLSQSTVSRALRDDPRVVPATRELVKSRAAALGYVVHVGARNLITQRTQAIAIISGDLHNPSTPTLVTAMQREFAEHDYRVVLMSDQTQGAHARDVEALHGGVVDGVVFNSMRPDLPLVAELRAQGLPVVLLARDHDDEETRRTDRVTSDNLAGGRLVAKHLLSLGHRRIALVGGPQDNASSIARERGFREELAAAGVALPRTCVDHGPVDPATGHRAMTRFLAGRAVPTAVFCITDWIALGALDAAHGAGLRVPADLHVVGYNDSLFAGWSMFDLTTVRQPFEDMGTAAARLLVSRIADPAGPVVHRRFPAELLVRSSTSGPVPRR